MAKRFGILAAVALTFAVAACTSPTAPSQVAPHVTQAQSAGGVLAGGDP